MSFALQNYLVYAIVGATFVYLVSPFVKMILGFFRKKKESQNEDDFSCYTGTCAKCELKK